MQVDPNFQQSLSAAGIEYALAGLYSTHVIRWAWRFCKFLNARICCKTHKLSADITKVYYILRWVFFLICSSSRHAISGHKYLTWNSFWYQIITSLLKEVVFLESWTLLLFAGPIVFIVVGCIMIIFGFFGCCGAIKESTCLLTTVNHDFIFIITKYHKTTISSCHSMYASKTYLRRFYLDKMNQQAFEHKAQCKRHNIGKSTGQTTYASKDIRKIDSARTATKTGPKPEMLGTAERDFTASQSKPQA